MLINSLLNFLSIVKKFSPLIILSKKFLFKNLFLSSLLLNIFGVLTILLGSRLSNGSKIGDLFSSESISEEIFSSFTQAIIPPE